MRLFISWSGQKSNKVANVLRNWLPAVIQAVRPYFTPDDIAKGTRWNTDIAKELDQSRVGLICLTSDNLEAPWIMFEAGALSKNLETSKVCPILFGVEPADIKGPLVQFQAVQFKKSEIAKLITMINGELGDNALPQPVLETVFDKWWPTLEEEIAIALVDDADAEVVVKRSDRDMLEEILELTRKSILRGGPNISPESVSDIVDGFQQLATGVNYAGDEDMLGALKKMATAIKPLLARTYSQPLRIRKWAQVERALLIASENDSYKDNDDVPF